MFHLLVIGAFFIVLMRDELPPGLIDASSPAEGLLSAALTLGGLALVWSICWGAIHLLTRAMDRTGRARLAMTAETLVLLARLGATAYFFIAVALLGWIDAVRAALDALGVGFLTGFGVDELIGASPALVSIAAGWLLLHPIDRRMREALILRDLDEGRDVYALPRRWQATWMACRHHLGIIVIPVALIIIWGESVESVASSWFGFERIEDAGASVQGVVTGVHLLGTLTIFTLMPPLMCRVWDTAPMTSGDTLKRLDAMCRQHRVRVRGIRVWSTRGSMVNGAVLGLIARFRYILLTDALLSSLPRREVEAVMAHEIAHVRRRHLIWLAAALLATLVFALMIGETIAAIVWPDAPPPDSAGAAITVLVLVLTIATFGFVSRRFEWQADAFAVAHLSRSPPASAFADPDDPPAPAPQAPVHTVAPEAISSMATALDHVAVLNGIPLKRFTFRHGSIADRQRRIRRLEGRSLARLPIDRAVRLIKLASLLALGAGISGYALLLML